MTVNFANIRALDIAEKVAKFELVELDGTPKPVLSLRPAGPDNRPYFNELIREFGAQINGRRAAKKVVSAEALEKTRAATRKMFPRFVVAGWEHVKDFDGNDVPFSVEACEELFAALPGYLLDELRVFAEHPESFLDREPVDIEGLAGN